MQAFLKWLPRILALSFIVFLSLFALDIFSEPEWWQGPWLVGLTVHFIPQIILLVFTFIAWKKARLGGLLFLLAGGAMWWFFHSLLIAFPAFIIGIFFLLQTVF